MSKTRKSSTGASKNRRVSSNVVHRSISTSPRNEKRATRRRSQFAGASASGAKKTVLISIFVMMLVVVIGSLVMYFFTPERQVKTKIEQMTADYFENYFYENMINSSRFQEIEDIDAEMEKFHVEGLQTMSLRDLLYYDNKKNYKDYEFLTRYCDMNNTVMRIYMDPPYERTSYHVDYMYSCNF